MQARLITPHASPEAVTGSTTPSVEVDATKLPLAMQAMAASSLSVFGPKDSDVVGAARAVIERCVGGFAVVAMITGWGLLAIRDPHGIRPLVYGKRWRLDGSQLYDYMVASESGAPFCRRLP